MVQCSKKAGFPETLRICEHASNLKATVSALQISSVGIACKDPSRAVSASVLHCRPGERSLLLLAIRRAMIHARFEKVSVANPALRCSWERILQQARLRAIVAADAVERPPPAASRLTYDQLRHAESAVGIASVVPRAILASLCLALEKAAARGAAARAVGPEMNRVVILAGDAVLLR